MPNPILDPTGRTSGRRAGVLAPRLATLRGATIGLLENTKQNAALLLEDVGRLLMERHGARAYALWTKPSFAVPAPDELVEEMARKCDVAITGVGDCGACSASAMADGILLEAQGVPAAVICSDAFSISADAMADLRGARGYRYVTTPHPVAPLRPEQVRERAATVLPTVTAILLAAEAVGAASHPATAIFRGPRDRDCVGTPG
jgi:hypothetical protein